MNAPSNLTAWERWELASFGEEKRAHPLQPAQPPSVAEAGMEDVTAVKLPTAEEIEQIHRQARDDGFQAGKTEGYQAGLKEGQAKGLAEAQRFDKATARFEKYLGELNAQVADEVLALSIELARQVLRQEISARPETLLAVVRDALGQLPHQHTSIYLHPEDASLLRSYMGDQLSHAGHRIHEDMKLARGDCVLEAGGSQIDATVAMRWRRVLENIGIVAAWTPLDDAAGNTPAAKPADES